jgi:hypothetical protein
MSTYYLKTGVKLRLEKYSYGDTPIGTSVVEYYNLDDAIDAAKIVSKLNPNIKIEILKCMGTISYVQTTTGEYQENIF